MSMGPGEPAVAFGRNRGVRQAVAASHWLPQTWLVFVAGSLNTGPRLDALHVYAVVWRGWKNILEQLAT